MANNYVEFSAVLKLPDNICNDVKSFIDELAERFEEEDEDFGVLMCEYTVADNEVWFRDNGEYGVPEHVVFVVDEIVNKFEIDDPFYMTWACTCSKKRIDEFGGGGCIVQRGYDIFWIDAGYEVMRVINERASANLK